MAPSFSSPVVTCNEKRRGSRPLNGPRVTVCHSIVEKQEWNTWVCKSLQVTCACFWFGLFFLFLIVKQGIFNNLQNMCITSQICRCYYSNVYHQKSHSCLCRGGIYAASLWDIITIDAVSAAGSFDEPTLFRCSRRLVSLPASIDEALPALNTSLIPISIFSPVNAIAARSGYLNNQIIGMMYLQACFHQCLIKNLFR